MLVTFVFLRTRAGTGHGQNQPIHREMLWNKEAAFNGKYREAWWVRIVCCKPTRRTVEPRYFVLSG